MDSKAIAEARQLVTQIGKIMLERNLTDLAGGNISVREGDHIIMTPSYAGTHRFWQLQPDDVLVLDLKGNLLEGNGKVSREAPTHLRLLNTFYPKGTAVIHAHARNVMVFCAAAQPIPPVLEYTWKFGEIKLAEYARGGAHSEKLAENVCKAFYGQEACMSRQAAAVMVPWHGLFTVGKNLYATLDAVERIEINARSILMGRLLSNEGELLEISRRELAEHMKLAEDGGGE